MKKIILTALVASGFFSQAIGLHDSKEIVAAGLVSGTACTGVMYAYHRENNAVKVEKIERIWRHVIDNVALARPQDFSKLISVFKNFDIFVYELQDSLQGRYDSWLTPWNWSSSMRLAYKKATMLQILFKYLDVLRYWRTAIPDDSIEQLAKPICKGEYSAVGFVRQLNSDMNVIQVIMKDLYCPFGNVLHEHLLAVREIVMCSHAYKKENVV